MKIAILTQPLHKNYGGIMQAYALQKVLSGLGHDVLTVDLSFRKSLYRKIRSAIGKKVRKHVFGQKGIDILSNKEIARITKHSNRFIRENIRLTEHISLVEKISKLKKYEFDAYVVGSDQVWRPKFSPGISTFFLDFVENDKNIKRLAYAASFGSQEWEFSEKMTNKCSKLAKRFNAISVREDSAVELCEKYLGVSALHVLDPTLLLDRDEYIKLVNKYNILKKNNTLMLYILDNSSEKEMVAENIKKRLNIEINSIVINKELSQINKENIENYIYPSVPQWIRGFIDASFVITDSYHGVIFSIIFNKPFLAISNEWRGTARLTSLLRVLNLEDRLINVNSNNINCDICLNKIIDYESISEILQKEKIKSINFINSNLEKNNGWSQESVHDLKL